MNPTHPKPTRSEQREAARAKAAELRARNQKNAARKKVLTIGSSILGVLAVAALVFVIVANNQPKPQFDPSNLGANGGIKIGTDLVAFTETTTPVVTPGLDGTVPTLITYLDYQCPACQAFELSNMAQIRQWVTEGRLALDIRPISFLDRASLNNYSSRAANAAYCVATQSPNKFFDFNEALFNAQPAENTAGPENSVIYAAAKSVGAENLDKIKNCIDDGSHNTYVKNFSDKSLSEPIPEAKDGSSVGGTPTIMMNGVVFSGDYTNAAEFSQWVLSFLTPTN